MGSGICWLGQKTEGKNVSEMITAKSDRSFMGQVLYFIKCHRCTTKKNLLPFKP